MADSGISNTHHDMMEHVEEEPLRDNEHACAVLQASEDARRDAPRIAGGWPVLPGVHVVGLVSLPSEQPHWAGAPGGSWGASPG